MLAAWRHASYQPTFALATRLYRGEGKMARQIITGLALGLALTASSFGAPQDAGRPRINSQRQITIRIHDYAKVKPSVLLTAERAAADIFREAGVDSNWVE